MKFCFYCILFAVKSHLFLKRVLFLLVSENVRSVRIESLLKLRKSNLLLHPCLWLLHRRGNGSDKTDFQSHFDDYLSTCAPIGDTKLGVI